MKKAWDVLRDAYAGWQRHQDGRLAAALAYYAVFALAPLLLVVISLLGIFLGQGNAHAQVQGQLQQVIGPSGAQMIGTLVSGANHHATGTTALIIGGALVLLSAIGVFMALQNALDEVFEVGAQAKGGFIALVVLRLHALIVIVALAIVAIAALALANTLKGPAYHVGSAVINVIAMTIFLAVVYRTLPRRTVTWKSARVGAAVTAVILIIGEAILSTYFAKVHPAAAYGAAGGIIILLLWIYYSAQLMLFGAEITRAYDRRLTRGSAWATRGEVPLDYARGASIPQHDTER